MTHSVKFIVATMFATLTLPTQAWAVVTIATATNKIALNGAVNLKVSGGSAPYTFAVTAGTGYLVVVDPVTQKLMPGALGDVTVRTVDSLGAEAFKTITVVPAVTLTPSPVTVLLNQSATLTAAGGVPPYVYSIHQMPTGPAVTTSGSVVGSGVDNVNGIFTASNTPEQVYVKVKDSIGNSRLALINVNGPVSLSPASAVIGLTNYQVFTPVGGKAPFTYRLASGDGTITPVTGSPKAVYRPGASTGSASVEITDASGATSVANVTINPALALTPTPFTMVGGTSTTFTAAGGVPPYSYSVSVGEGSINAATGAFTASTNAGTATIKVTDALGTFKTAWVRVNAPLAVNPSTKTIAVNNYIALIASGGVPPYTFAQTSGAGALVVKSAAAAVFTANTTTGVSNVRVTDAQGTNVDVPITVAPAIELVPSTLTLVLGNTFNLSAINGAPPYTWAMYDGLGSVSATGQYTPPSFPGFGRVIVRDSMKNPKVIRIRTTPPVRVSDQNKYIPLSGVTTVVAFYGEGPYAYSLVSGGGSLNSATGEYQAPATAGDVVIRATDVHGNTGDGVFTVYGPLSLASMPSLMVNDVTALVPSGGVPPYAFSITSGGGSMDPASGTFTAPSAAGTVGLHVVDFLGAQADGTITIEPALQISPTSKTIAVANSASFSATGGIPPYSYSVISGAGSVDASSGQFVAGGVSGPATVRVSDSAGHVSDAVVTVNPALAILPATKLLAVNNGFTFSATGGVAPYAYSLVSGTGSIVAGNGLYTAPGLVGSASVRVTDSLGNVSDSLVTINPALAAAPASYWVRKGMTGTVTATGGVPSYSYAVFSGAGAVDPATGVYTAPTTIGTATVRVYDSLSNSSDATMNIFTSGMLDTQPGTLGKVVSPISTVNTTVTAVAAQADGKMLVYGTYAVSANANVVVARYLSTGVLDTTFGTGGYSIIDLGANDVAAGMALQADGKILLAGSAGNAFVVARLLTTGALDTAFGTAGLALPRFTGGVAAGKAVAVQPDGKIVAAGSAKGGDVAVVRFLATGALDTAFGTSGKTLSNFGGTESANAVAIQSDGKIVLAGENGADFIVARFTAAGAADTTFNTTGRVTTDVNLVDTAKAVALQSDGKIVVAGTANNLFAVVRYTSTGALDTTYNTTGKLTRSVGTGASALSSMLIDSSNNLYLAGKVTEAGIANAVVTRLTSTGAFDTTFVTGGIFKSTIGTGNADIAGMANYSTDRVVVAGPALSGAQSVIGLMRVWK